MSEFFSSISHQIIKNKKSWKSFIKKLCILERRGDALNKLDVIQLLLQFCIDWLPSLVEPNDAMWSGLKHSINIQKEFFQPGSLSTTGWAAHIHSHGMLKYKFSFNNVHLGSIQMMW